MGGNKYILLRLNRIKAGGPSTWIFIDSGSKKIYTSDDMKEQIEYYIEQDLKYDEFFFDVLKKKKLIFNRKAHKKGNVDDIGIERWCKGILKKVLHPEIIKREV